jgi:hypothetical protein
MSYSVSVSILTEQGVIMKRHFVFFLLLISLGGFGQSSFNDESIKTSIQDELQSYFGNQKSWPLLVGGLQYNNMPTKLGVVLQNSISAAIIDSDIEIPVLGELRTQIIRDTGLSFESPLEPKFVLAGRVDVLQESATIYYFLTDLERGTMVKSFEFTQSLSEIRPLLISQGSGNNGEYDFGEPDGYANPRELESSSLGNLSFHDGDDKDYILIVNTNEESRVLSFETQGDLDTLITLYNGDSREILAENDDGGEGNNAKIVRVVPEDFRGILEIKPYDQDEEGEYTISYSWEPVPEMDFEPNEDQASAFQLEIGESLDLSFFPSGDEDWFKTTVPELDSSQALNIYTTGDSDTILEVYDSSGSLLYENDDTGDSTTSQILAFVQGQEVFIRVREYDGEIGDYGLAVEQIRVQLDEFEPDNSQDEASLIPFDEPQSHSLIPSDDEDWFRFVLSANSEVTLRTLSSIDTYIEIFDSSGIMIAEDDDSGDGYNAFIQKDLTEGEYYFKVYLVGSETVQANYDVIVTVE